MQSQDIVRIEKTGIPYAAFAMMGTLLGQVFVDAINSPPTSFNAGKAMLTKINFPREAFVSASFQGKADDYIRVPPRDSRGILSVIEPNV